MVDSPVRSRYNVKGTHSERANSSLGCFHRAGEFLDLPSGLTSPLLFGDYLKQCSDPEKYKHDAQASEHDSANNEFHDSLACAACLY
jgi:hypothetical protein